MSRTRTVNTTSTSTGTLAAVDLYQVVSTIAAEVNHPSTKAIAWKVQGSLNGVHWRDVLAVTSTSTGTAAVLSSVPGLYNQARIVVTANATTGNVTTKWTLGGTP